MNFFFFFLLIFILSPLYTRRHQARQRMSRKQICLTWHAIEKRSSPHLYRQLEELYILAPPCRAEKNEIVRPKRSAPNKIQITKKNTNLPSGNSGSTICICRWCVLLRRRSLISCATFFASKTPHFEIYKKIIEIYKGGQQRKDGMMLAVRTFDTQRGFNPSIKFESRWNLL